MGQVIAFDTAVLIYYFEDHPILANRSRALLLPVILGKAQGIFATIGLIELLVAPKKLGNKVLEQQYKSNLFNFTHLKITNLNEGIIDQAAGLRAKYGLRTPDAIHLATAIFSHADIFVTNDRSLKKVKEIAIRLLADVPT